MLFSAERDFSNEQEEPENGPQQQKTKGSLKFFHNHLPLDKKK
ncbi:unnamed protein product [Larinioides sclopetarius]|uniref:Uncharacterized protein n=1 Tax=Larinioides sclopetarius TaxID=280406 RepID=A0AAV2B5X2_9ARAC